MDKINSNTTENNSKILNEKDAGIFYSATMLSILAIVFMAGACITMFVGETDVSKTNWYLILNFFFSGIALMVASLVGTRLTGSNVKNNVGKLTFDWQMIVVCVLIIFAMFFALGDLNNWIITLFSKFGYKSQTVTMPEKSFINVLLIIISVCIIPAVFEEYIFRGCILKGLSIFGEKKAILFSSLLFSFYHMSPDKTLYQFVVGLLFGFIALKFKSILPCVIIHFINNLYVILNHYYFNFNPQGGLKAVLFIFGVLFLVGGLILLTNKFKFENDTKKGSFHEFIVYGSAGMLGAVAVWISGFML